MSAQTQDSQNQMTPQSALDMLQQGNQRFASASMAGHPYIDQVQQTATGQFPFAVVLSCIDSRVSAELVFDQGVGDIFSARVAGNIVNGDTLGSMEFACKLAGSKLVVVLGHSSCGAVKGACDGAELGNLTGLLQKIQPAVDEIRKSGELERADLVQKVADLNVKNVISEIRQKSSVLDEMIRGGEIGIVGAMYHVDSGEVEFGSLVTGA